MTGSQMTMIEEELALDELLGTKGDRELHSEDGILLISADER